MDNLVEKLKDKNYVRAFGLMTPEERETYRNAGKINCLIYSGVLEWSKAVETSVFNEHRTYAIKPDYQPEPEYEDFEVVKQIGHFNNLACTELLGCEVNIKGQKYFVKISDLPSLPNFECFWNKIPSPIYSENAFCCLGLVNRMRNSGHTVYARFRT